MSDAAVTVYTRSGPPKCVACAMTTRHLTKRGIPFAEVDVDDDPGTRLALDYLGLSSLPVVVVATALGEQVFAGYRPDRLDALAVPA